MKEPWRRKPWRLLRHGPATGARNMAVDEAVQTVCARTHGGPTLRFYAWSPAALSLGYFQKTAEVNLESCRRQGVDVVRRPTGGRAILHDAEVTYSVVLAEEDLPGGVLETYRIISAALHRGLTALGAPVEITARRPRGRAGLAGGSAACFDAPSWHELEAGGRKVAGSAQTRREGVILQHGSIPVRLDSRKLFSLLSLDPECRDGLAREFAGQAVDLREAIGREIGFDEVCRSLEAGFAEALGVGLEPGELTAAEEEVAAELETVKYGNPSWNFKR